MYLFITINDIGYNIHFFHVLIVHRNSISYVWEKFFYTFQCIFILFFCISSLIL